jgi:hypothetical protein
MGRVKFSRSNTIAPDPRIRTASEIVHFLRAAGRIHATCDPNVGGRVGRTDHPGEIDLARIWIHIFAVPMRPLRFRGNWLQKGVLDAEVTGAATTDRGQEALFPQI